MGYYSNPTEQIALGNINREFSKLEKKAKRLRDRYKNGEISEVTLEKAHSEFTGLYRHVLTNALEEKKDE